MEMPQRMGVVVGGDGSGWERAAMKRKGGIPRCSTSLVGSLDNSWKTHREVSCVL